MTQAFLIFIRIVAVGLFLYWAYRLWRGTHSWTSRLLGLGFSVLLIWKIASGNWM